jgi:hypothetical protein
MDRARMKNKIVMLTPVTRMLDARFAPSQTLTSASFERPLGENRIVKITRSRPNTK